MKYKLLTLFILSLTVTNVSVAEEKKKENYFGDDKKHSREFKKNNKQARNKPANIETRGKKDKKRRRVRLSTDTH